MSDMEFCDCTPTEECMACVIRRSRPKLRVAALVMLAIWAVMLAIGFASLGGCHAHATSGVYRLPVQPHEIEFLRELAAQPDGAAMIENYMRNRPVIQIAGVSTDGFEKVTSDAVFSYDPVTGRMTAEIKRGNDVNVESIKAAGEAAGGAAATAAATMMREAAKAEGERNLARERALREVKP